MVNVTERRPSATEFEGLSPAIVERASRLTYSSSLAETRAALAGLPMPERDEIAALCSSCDEAGWSRSYLAEVGEVTGACRHLLGWMAYLVTSESIPVRVRKVA